MALVLHLHGPLLLSSMTPDQMKAITRLSANHSNCAIHLYPGAFLSLPPDYLAFKIDERELVGGIDGEGRVST